MNYSTLSLEKLVEVALDKGCQIYTVGGTPGAHNDPKVIPISIYSSEQQVIEVIINHLTRIDQLEKEKGWIKVIEDTIEKYKNK